MRVLVTGATGFIGRHLVSLLLAHGHEVTALSRDENKARDCGWINKVNFLPCDIHKPIEHPFRSFGEPDVIVHLAWNGLPHYQQLFHFERNLFWDYSFLKSLIEDGAQHLVVTGTCLEYGMQSGCLSESMPSLPANPYALAKDTLRRFLDLLVRDREVVVQWPRLFYMYGPGQSSASLLSQLDRAIDGEEDVFNLSGGEQLRDYLPVEDVASRLMMLMMHPNCSGVVNICSGEPISIRRLVETHLAKRGANIRLNFGYYPYPDYEPMAFWGDSHKYHEHCIND